ncbi:putative polyol transporter 1 [Rhodamnia argentea]|uniref:Polyol transporter 1 n=1 Tax=Rhodamnia argentea TaxID=178133 RepID=A0A8B8N364_9MYRT|nr:putative polyol transporter 1 [Rhodamnia argentea]
MATHERRERASSRLLAESNRESEREILPDTEQVTEFNVNQPESDPNSGPSSANSSPPRNRWSIGFVARCALLACITSALLGLEVGLLSEIMSAVKKDQGTTDEHVELVTFVLHIVALVGSILTGLLSDYIGRRYTIIFVGALFVFAPSLMALASSSFLVMLGRTFAHVGVGYTLTLAPVYVAELSAARSRGFLSSLPQVFINAGNFLGCIGNYFIFRSKFRGWPLMVSGGIITLFFVAIAVLAMPESPQWLVMQGRLFDAHLVLLRTSKSDEEAKLQLTKIQEAAGVTGDHNQNNANVSNENGRFWNLLRQSPSVRHILICAVGMQFFQQACGVDTLLLYSPQIFEKAGVTFSDDKFLLTVEIELVKMIFTLVASCLLDRLGRRPLLLWSIAGIIVSLLTLGMSLTELDQSDYKDILRGDKDWWASTCIKSLFACVASFSVGLAPVTPVFTAEVFPVRLRARGCAFSYAANQVASAMVAFVFSWFYNKSSLSVAVNLIAVIACIAWAVFFLIIPETKGRTLEEMRHFFGQIIGWDYVAREIDRERIEPFQPYLLFLPAAPLNASKTFQRASVPRRGLPRIFNNALVVPQSLANDQSIPSKHPRVVGSVEYALNRPSGGFLTSCFRLSGSSSI